MAKAKVKPFMRPFGELGTPNNKVEPNLPKDVMCVNRHGRKVSVSYVHYMDHGRFNGLTLVEGVDAIRASKTKIAKVVKPKPEVEVEGKKEEVIVEDEVVEEEVFICSVCGKVCKSKAGLTTHLKTHETKDKVSKKK